ncbi:MAG TPA: GNAT family N-acetyltransferase, partial [Rhizomicrobium sp.]
MTNAVRKLGPNEIAPLREIRLEGLRLHPEFFGADLEIEEAMPLQQWSARLVTGVTFGGFANGILSGMVVFVKSRGLKTAHTGELGAMYVREAARGTGLANALVAALI